MNIIKIIAIVFILNRFLYASEEIPTQEEVTKLYVATFNRAPDSAGLIWWIDSSNLKLSEIAQSFFDQPEAKILYPDGTSNNTFITSVYQNLFNRLPDIEGLNYWDNRLTIGAITKNSFIQAVINGALDNEISNDATILANKTSVGLSFAQAGLNNIDDAKTIMIGIGDDINSVNNALIYFNIYSLNVSDEQYYKYLWHIDSANSHDEYIIGEISTDADINILDAWKITKGKGVKVAVIDDGGDINHEDLKANIYLVYNADDGTADISNKSNNIDSISHGNSCAGFIAAPINGVGIIGSAPESKLILIKQDEASDAKTIRAFEYAKNNGAKVISCSWGTGDVSDAVTAELKSLYDAGITVIFASGNNGKSLDDAYTDESEVQWVIGVGSSGENNDVTSYSDYGTKIDLLAPGGDTQDSVGILGLDDSGTQGSTNNYGLVSNSYAFMDGTSFAAPIVAGIVALMYEVNPNITPKQVRDILIATADKIGGTNANYQNGFDEKRAYGKVNALKAVQEAKKLPTLLLI